MIKTAFELKTIGKLLEEKRKSKKLSYDEISEVIKINPEYLEALENADYAKFPSEVYVKGFLRNYSRFLGIDPDHALALYRREQENAQEAPKIKVTDKIKSKSVDLSITRSRILTTIATFLAVLTIIYVGSYVFDIFQKPRLELSEPVALAANERGDFVSETDSVTLEGVSEIGNKLTINGQEYRVNSFEQFNVEIKLQQGTNDIRLVSENQLRRRSETLLTVLYEPQTPTEPEITPVEEEPPETTAPISVRIEVIAQGAYLEAKVDNQLEEARAFPVNEVINFAAQEIFELFIPRTESINLFVNGELQTISSPRLKYQVIDGRVSKINQ